MVDVGDPGSGQVADPMLSTSRGVVGFLFDGSHLTCNEIQVASSKEAMRRMTGTRLDAENLPLLEAGVTTIESQWTRTRVPMFADLRATRFML